MSNQSQPYPIPAHWSWSKLGGIGDVHSGSTPSTKDDSNFGGKIPWLTPADLSDYHGKYVSKGSRNITEKGLSSCSARLLPEGSVLFSSRAPIGYTVIAKNLISTNQGFKNLIPGDRVTSEYVYHYLLASKSLAESYASGTTFKELSAARFKKIPIPVPPLPEQRQIVDKIEELFSNLDAGVASLKTARRQVDRYRQSVLQAAVEGRLTADWRQSHAPEPAEELLERILEERRAQWEKDYRAKYEAKGKEPPSGWKKRYKEPESPDTEDLSALPEGWIWTNTDSISTVYGGVTKNSRKGGDLVSMPYLRVANVYANELRLDEIKKIKVKRSRLQKYLLEKGDLLVVEGNGSKSQIGRVALWDGSLESCVHQNHLIKVRPGLVELGKYMLLWMLSINGRRFITRVASSTSGLYTLSLTKVKSIPVPLPSLAEQKQIVAEVERLLSVADDTAATIDRELQRAERLRQSILKQAFSGKLVTPDPDSAPAPQPTTEPTGQVTMDL